MKRIGYMLKENASKDIRRKYKNEYLVQQVGISKVYLSLILNRHRVCSKQVAYCITKAINSEAEVEDFFEVV